MERVIGASSSIGAGPQPSALEQPVETPLIHPVTRQPAQRLGALKEEPEDA